METNGSAERAARDLTEADVVRVIEEALRVGENPTIPYIRKKLGSGSNETIQKYRQKYFQHLMQEKAKETPGCLESFRAIWDQAVEQGRNLGESACADLRENNEALVAETDGLIAANNRLKELLGSETERKDDLICQLKGAHEMLAAERLARDGAVAAHAAAQQRIEDLSSKHTAEIAAERSARDACIQDHSARVEKFMKEADRLKAQIETLNSKVTDLSWEKRQREQLESELTSVRAERNQMKREIAELQTGLRHAETKAIRLEAQVLSGKPTRPETETVPSE